METETIEQVNLSRISKVPMSILKGKWALLYKTKNSQGGRAFGGIMIPNYDHPISQLPCPLKNVANKKLQGLFISNLDMRLYPDKDKNAIIQIDWLLSHPMITVNNIKELDPDIINSKNNNGQISLVCLDKMELDHLDEEDFIDKIVGQISLDSGKHALSLQRLKHTLAYLNQPYNDLRFKVGTVEKKSLRSKLKAFTRKSVVNARLVEVAIGEREGAKNSYEIKEMLRLSIVRTDKGMYTYARNPIGSDYSTLVNYFIDNPEIFIEARAKLYKLLDVK